MKKLLLAVAISIGLSGIAHAEISNDSESQKLSYWSSIDEKYAKQVMEMTPQEALEIEREKYSTREELFMAGLFYYGDQKYQDKRRALDLFMASADDDFIPAIFFAGKMLISGEGGKSNMYMGQDMLASIRGDYYYVDKSNQILAEMALSRRDYTEAVKYLSKIKSKESLYQIAKIYEYRGEKEVASLVYKEAISAGFVDAKIEMATRLLEKGTLNTKRAIGLLTEVANTGTDPNIVGKAQTLLGDIYFYGNQEMYANHEEGVKWYKKAANNNYVEGMLKLQAVYLENEKDNRYRLGSNKYYLQDLSVKIRKTIENEGRL